MKIKEGFVLQSFADGFVAMPADTEKFGNAVISLNKTSAFLWQLLQTDTDVDSLVAKLTERYEVSPEKALEDVNAFIQVLEKHSIIDL